jgi:hypothetical protein
MFSLWKILAKFRPLKIKRDILSKAPCLLQTKICQTSEELFFGKLLAHLDTISIFGAVLCRFSTVLKDLNLYVAN